MRTMLCASVPTFYVACRYGLTSKAWSDDSDEDLTESLAAPPDSAGADSADAGAALQARAETSAEQEASGVARSDSPTGSFSLAPAGAADGAERNDSMMHDDDVIELDPALRPTSHYAPFAEPPPMAAVPYERPSDGPTRAPPPRGAFPATATDPGFMLSALPVRVPDASGGGARSTATEALNSAWAPTRVTLRAPLPRQEVSPPSEPLPDTLHPAIAALASATSGTLHGAMSRARRVACGAGGLVAMPAPSADSSEVRIARVQPGVTARPQQAQRRAVRLLEVHAQYSRRVEDGNAVVMADGPDWVFACTADMEPCAEFAAVCTDSAAEAPGASGPGGADAAAAAAFDLAHRLLARIAPLDGPAGADAVVTAAQRKREVSVWLEDQAEREVHTALKQVRAPFVPPAALCAAHRMPCTTLSSAMRVAVAIVLLTACWHRLECSPSADCESARQSREERARRRPAAAVRPRLTGCRHPCDVLWPPAARLPRGNCRPAATRRCAAR